MSDLGIPLRNPEDVELGQIFTIPSEIPESPSRFYVRGLTSYSTDNFINPHHKSINPDGKLPHLNNVGPPRPKTSSNGMAKDPPLFPRIQLNSQNKMSSGASGVLLQDKKKNSIGYSKPEAISRETSMSKSSAKGDSHGKAKKGRLKKKNKGSVHH